MNPTDIRTIRLANQKLVRSQFTAPQEIVSWMGAMQAQDFPMAEWAVGIRLLSSTARQVEAAIDQGDILRTHLLRPTWHFVVPEDISWLLDLTAPQIIASQRSRDRGLELTPAVYSQSNRVIEQALRQSRQLTREQLVAELNHAGIATDQNRASHLLMRAELEKIICSGAILRGKPTYALFSQRASKPRHLVKEEALAKLALRYFTSRGPATLQDFAWWSGLPAGVAKAALEAVKGHLIPDEINGTTYWLTEYPAKTVPPIIQATLLPTYDEMIISYADRSASIPAELEQHMKEISDRGVFWPTVMINGMVVGTWKRTIKKNAMIVEFQPFSHLLADMLQLVEKAATRFAGFCEKNLVFNLSTNTI